jgi:hypothetical protein
VKVICLRRDQGRILGWRIIIQVGYWRWLFCLYGSFATVQSVGSNWKSFALGVRWGIGHRSLSKLPQIPQNCPKLPKTPPNFPKLPQTFPNFPEASQSFPKLPNEWEETSQRSVTLLGFWGLGFRVLGLRVEGFRVEVWGSIHPGGEGAPGPVGSFFNRSRLLSEHTRTAFTLLWRPNITKDINGLHSFEQGVSNSRPGVKSEQSFFKLYK